MIRPILTASIFMLMASYAFAQPMSLDDAYAKLRARQAAEAAAAASQPSTTQPSGDQASAVQASIPELQAEITRLKSENAALKKQILALQQAAIKAPAGGAGAAPNSGAVAPSRNNDPTASNGDAQKQLDTPLNADPNDQVAAGNLKLAQTLVGKKVKALEAAGLHSKPIADKSKPNVLQLYRKADDPVVILVQVDAAGTIVAANVDGQIAPTKKTAPE